VLEDGEIYYPVTGSPQGGVISPLLANIYLDQLDEVYYNQHHTTTTWERAKRLKQGESVLRLIRYADDFVILAKGERRTAEQSLEQLDGLVRDKLRMSLAEEKTGV
jgi:RNA-directed DNA polymerase